MSSTEGSYAHYDYTSPQKYSHFQRADLNPSSFSPEKKWKNSNPRLKALHVLPKTGKGGGRVEEEEAEIGDGKGRVERKGRVGLEEGTKEK